MSEPMFRQPWTSLVMQAMSEGVLGLDQEYRITCANRSAEHLLGWASQELVGRQLHDLLQPRRLAGGAEKESPLAWLQEGGELYFIEDVFQRKDGSSIDCELSAFVLPQSDCSPYAVVLLHDISERKENQAVLLKAFQDRDVLNKGLETAQGQLLQAEKMASVGQLAAGVAHEINNPIGFVNSNLGTLRGQVASLLSVIAAYEQTETALSGFPDLLEAIGKAKLSADFDYLKEDIQNLIAESLDGIVRVKKIVDNLKDFSRVDSAEWQYANLENGLDSTLSIVWNEIKYKAEVIKDYAGLPEIECIASQLNQVFMNLLVNAAHAIEVRGLITLRTGFDEDKVWVEIEDTGSGIRAEHLAKIFEPFFTTKPVGKGTGLGLSLAYGIVQHHKGNLVACSEFGKGSVFRVSIPRKRAKVDDCA